MSAFPIEDALKPECDCIRADLLAIEKRVRLHLDINHDGYTAVIGGADVPVAQAREMSRHALLAVAAIEDARMRIGKVLQHARDGVSCFDAPDAADVLAKARAAEWEQRK